ncbi:MAG TPA: hypothetical protein VK476_05805, partial [Flavobacterium sp.]|nr:hypothetical protein [Flavobacterium sp.]
GKQMRMDIHMVLRNHVFQIRLFRNKVKQISGFKVHAKIHKYYKKHTPKLLYLRACSDNAFNQN